MSLTAQSPRFFAGVFTWEPWAHFESFQKFEYVSGDRMRDGNLNKLRDHLSTTRRVARLVGLPGLGKTRLALEVFRPPDTPDLAQAQYALSRRVVYMDAGASGAAALQSLLEWVQAGLEGVIVVDNCSTHLHEQLFRAVRHTKSKLSLLSLGPTTEKQSAQHAMDDYLFVQLDRVDDAVVKRMLEQAYPNLRSGDMDFIVREMAQGFPHMAELLADARLNEIPDIRQIIGDQLLHRMLGIDPHRDGAAYAAICTCALFTNLGFEAEAASEYGLVCDLIGIDPDDFYAHMKNFIGRGVVTEHGRFVQVRPTPLAMRLAADWWSHCSPSRAQKIIKGSLSEGLTNALCERVRMLDFLPEVRKLVAGLCAVQGPFGQAEVLNSELGSRLFRALVEVNPDATLDALRRVVDTWSEAYLKQSVGPGRRNLVLALEKLCFWERTFSGGAQILLRFAASENEEWSNNATGQFEGLFKVMLSGTQAPPSARLFILDRALDSRDRRVRGARSWSTRKRTRDDALLPNCRR